MRMMLKWNVPVEKGNAMVSNGSMGTVQIDDEGRLMVGEGEFLPGGFGNGKDPSVADRSNRPATVEAHDRAASGKKKGAWLIASDTGVTPPSASR